MDTYKTDKQIYDVKRTEIRITNKFTVNVKFKERAYSGIAGNISKSGIYIEAIGLIPENDEEVAVSLIGDNSIFDLYGDIRWSTSIPMSGADEMIYGFGIKLHSVPAGYLNLVEYLKIS
jgi:hypothetical protein